MVVGSWTLNDHLVTRDLSWWICPHGDHRMAICMRCYHPFDFIYVELKRHRPHCPRWYSGRHRRCVGYSPNSRLTHLLAICMRCYHPFDFIYVELKRHRPHCPRWYSGRHLRCVGYSPNSRLTHLFRRCSL